MARRGLLIVLEVDWGDWSFGAYWRKEDGELWIGGPVVSLMLKLVTVEKSRCKGKRIGFGGQK